MTIIPLCYLIKVIGVNMLNYLNLVGIQWEGFQLVLEQVQIYHSSLIREIF